MQRIRQQQQSVGDLGVFRREHAGLPAAIRVAAEIKLSWDQRSKRSASAAFLGPARSAAPVAGDGGLFGRLKRNATSHRKTATPASEKAFATATMMGARQLLPARVSASARLIERRVAA
jgi:hypothetical protein